ncbi:MULTISPECIES: hypothetical protein [Bacillus]|uniref:DUF5065 domain-containing protein n=1 Tax=Bacillus cereus TaxID=1396 RepID=A0A9X7B807_BACCE|nr:MULTISPECIES: hypothetical protein [Bacillus cereus group]KXZ03789.1 hypothetical protein AT281_25035 [Bacillus cereus]MBE4939641.1 DUF5065 domain-containing protein [Bacillus thuringiensis]MCU5243490.1 DUF5065 domain-containing protein [Bacillus cereus]MDA2462556.1 DUF5065 domain-containing protein [Bacillus cereus]MDR4439977.1 DUF5065 domain-containing protein [Bacillus cereus]
MKPWKKKMGMTMLASAMALGGVATLELVNPVSKAAAASGYGASVNTTKANHYVGTDSYIHIKIKNDNKAYEVELRIQPQIQRTNGTWENVNKPLISWFVPGEYVGMNIDIGRVNYDGVGIYEKGKYRLKVDTYKTTSSGSVYLGTFNTDVFYLK